MSSFFVVANDRDEVLDTLLHEIAHALAGPLAGHGPVWKAACVRVGARPERLAPPEVAMPKGRWHARCPGCATLHTRHRRPMKGRDYFCRGCGTQRGLLQFALSTLRPGG